jgi:hypothetical protein
MRSFHHPFSPFGTGSPVAISFLLYSLAVLSHALRACSEAGIHSFAVAPAPWADLTKACNERLNFASPQAGLPLLVLVTDPANASQLPRVRGKNQRSILESTGAGSSLAAPKRVVCSSDSSSQTSFSLVWAGDYPEASPAAMTTLSLSSAEGTCGYFAAVVRGSNERIFYLP